MATATAKDLFEKILLRLRSNPPEHDFLTVMDMVIRAIDRRLMELGSDLIKSEQSEDLAADECDITLPTDMLAIANHPVISYTGTTRKTLYPLPEDKRWSYEDTGVPQYYEVRGTIMRVYPTCDQAVTVRFETYDRQSVESMTADVPYGGLFDDLIIELLVRYGANPAAASVDPSLELMVRKAVDQVIGRRVPKNIRFRFSL